MVAEEREEVADILRRLAREVDPRSRRCLNANLMNTSDVLRQRLHNQKLSSSEFENPADVVRWLGAVQAQDYSAAKWALASENAQCDACA